MAESDEMVLRGHRHVTVTTRTTTSLVENRTPRTPLRARRAPSLVGGARICFEERRHGAKITFFVPEGRLFKSLNISANTAGSNENNTRNQLYFELRITNSDSIQINQAS